MANIEFKQALKSKKETKRVFTLTTTNTFSQSRVNILKNKFYINLLYI